MSDKRYEADESAMSESEKLAYVLEVRDIFGDDAAESVAEQFGIFLPSLAGPNPGDAVTLCKQPA